jgi:predicted amidohydrolase YtcJ
MVTRKFNASAPAWLPEQRATVEEGLVCYTRNSAYSNWRDNIGSLEVGKLADFVILDKDIFEITAMEIGKVKILSTHLGGVQVYDSEEPFSLN